MTCDHMTFDNDDPVCQQIGLGAAALRYQQLGFAVIPLRTGQKRPHEVLGNRGGIHHASRDPADVWRWWGEAKSANIGIATGSVNRLLVLDLDTKHGTDGVTIFGDYVRQYGLEFPAAPWVRTPSGGAHIWLRSLTAQVPDRTGRSAIMPGTDVRGEGGLVVAPPSMLAGQEGTARPGEHSAGQGAPRPYVWHGCACQALAAAPAWLEHALATWGPGGLEQAAGKHGDLTVPDLDELRQTGVPKGGRNDTLYRLACRLWRQAGNYGEVMAGLREVWAAGDTTGMPESDLRTICDSARRFVQAQQADEVAQRAARLAGLGFRL
jgi:hypothetical protein